jgi:mono/diheme cytochrome c family protein
MPHRLALLLLFAVALPAGAAAPPAPITFEQHIRPILRAHCLECHGEAAKPKGGLDLRLRRLLAAGGDSGPAVVPGKPGDSLLYQRLRDREMPPGQVKLSAAEIDLVRRWISAGAPTARPEPDRLPPGPYISDEERSFWSFQPIRRPAVPAVCQARLVGTPVDAFLLAALEAKGLSFAPEADRRTLIRRLSFDLVGLPPAPEEVAAFVADRRPDAYERLVERLLASPHHGERWGRHWLDVAGYADSHGYTGSDPVRPHAWKYRNWVIRALNADLGYDQFVTKQLAGDELVRPPYTYLNARDRDHLIATGFLRTAPDGTASPGVDQRAASDQVVADTIQIVSTAVLGLTMHCARCHNHRYDPIPQSDYYRLRAVFEPAYDVSSWRAPTARLVTLLSPPERARSQQIELAAQKIDRQRLARQGEHIERIFQKQLARVPADVRAAVEKAYRTAPPKRTKEQQHLLRQHPSVNVSPGSLYLYDRKAADDLAALAAKAAKLRATKPAEDFLDALTEVPGKVPPTRLLHRGDPTQPRQVVEPGGLSVLAGLDLAGIPAKSPGRATTGRRLALARQLVSGKHPLTARAIVNRVWLHHFGQGIVNTPGDLGFLGERPTHPELLDWLASELMRDWSLKRLHRLIVLSRAYRQSSRLDAIAHKVDPDARLLWRMPVRRLEAEIVRDAVLSVSGRLYTRLYGPPVPVTPDEVGQVVLGVDLRDGAGRPTGRTALLGQDLNRRSVYVQVRRSKPLTVLETFDAPVLEPCSDRRSSSTVAQQALLLMNSRFATDNAAAFAARLRRDAGNDLRAQLRRAWLLAYARPPAAGELADAEAFVHAQAALYRAGKRPREAPSPEAQALAVLCQALLSSNAFLYVD